ncbi:hypothetical protein FRX31_020768, partial [Thalictrum thalictroides]
QWHDDNKGKHNLNLDDVKPAIINPTDLLLNLACTMYKENFNSLSRIYRRRVVVEHTDTYIKLIDRPSQRQITIPPVCFSINRQFGAFSKRIPPTSASPPKGYIKWNSWALNILFESMYLLGILISQKNLRNNFLSLCTLLG